jgi:hypothetical protein
MKQLFNLFHIYFLPIYVLLFVAWALMCMLNLPLSVVMKNGIKRWLQHSSEYYKEIITDNIHWIK